MREFALAPEIEELRGVAERLAQRELLANVRTNEAAGHWPEEVLAVLDDMPLGGLDLPERFGGVEAGALAKCVVLETLAIADAGGLPGADRPGPCVGAVEVCPDPSLARASLDGGSALTVIDPEVGGDRLNWAPGWPTLRWIWVSEGDDLRLLEVTGTVEPVVSLAFGASGAASVPFSATTERGRWTLSPGAAHHVRARARLWAAAIAVGIAQAALDETLEYTTDRVVFGKPVAHHQGNAFDIARVASRVHAARLVVRDAAAAFDREEPFAPFWATQAWLETMEAALDATNNGIQLLGGHGFILDHLAEKRFREARQLALLAGGIDAAEFDVASEVLDVPDPISGAVSVLGNA